MSKLNKPDYTDEILEEVWRIKDELAAKFDYDVDRMLQDAREKQQQSGRTVVEPPPRKTVPKKTA